MKVILGITGSIAAYKALELIRLLRREGNDVKVVLTESACHFITPLTCQTLSDNQVYLEQFCLTKGIKHISLNDWGDIFVVAPATANIIGKVAHGIADDLLSTALLSFQKPVLFVPAMDTGMWENKILQKNVMSLKKCGYYFLEPETGSLASGKIGKGRFPELMRIYRKILTTAKGYELLADKRILITGGRTEEDIDTVRVVTNRSTGMMALELYEAAKCREAEVRLIMGETNVTVPCEKDIIHVRTAEQMYQMVRQNIEWADVLIMAAAVGDYRPKECSNTKIHLKNFALEFQKNIDILKSISKYKKNRVFVGFSVEDKNARMRALSKIKEKGLDLLVSNPPQVIGKSTTSAVILKRDGSVIEPGIMTKWEMANFILDLIGSKKR